MPKEGKTAGSPVIVAAGLVVLVAVFPRTCQTPASRCTAEIPPR